MAFTGVFVACHNLCYDIGIERLNILPPGEFGFCRVLRGRNDRLAGRGQRKEGPPRADCVQFFARPTRIFNRGMEGNSRREYYRISSIIETYSKYLQ